MRASFKLVTIVTIAISCGTLCEAGNPSVPDICSVDKETYKRVLSTRDNYNRIILSDSALKSDMSQFNRVCYKKTPEVHFADSMQYLAREYLMSDLRLADDFFESALAELEKRFQGTNQPPEVGSLVV